MAVPRGFGIERALGQALREHRVAAGLSQEQLGFEAKISRNFVSLIETGRRCPSVCTLSALAAVVGVAPSELLREAEARMR